MVVSMASLIIFFILLAVLTFVFSNKANIFDSDLRKRFLLLSAFIASKILCVASVSLFSSYRWFSKLFVSSWSI